MELTVDDRVDPLKSSDSAGSSSVDPEIQNLLKVFVRQNKETGESITLYADKMDTHLPGLLSQRPSLPSAPDQVVQMILPINFGTETPGDDILASILQESVGGSKTRPGEPVSSSRREAASPVPGVTGLELSQQPLWVRDSFPDIYRE